MRARARSKLVQNLTKLNPSPPSGDFITFKGKTSPITFRGQTENITFKIAV